jgi:hypothetical protein
MGNEISKDTPPKAHATRNALNDLHAVIGALRTEIERLTCI